MKLKVLQENLSKALINASRFTTSKAQLPILGNIKLETKKTKLIVSATNLEMSTSISLGAQVEKDGEIAIPARVITEVINNLQPGTISLVAEKEQLKISASSFSSVISGMNTSDLPLIPQKVNEEKSFSLPKEKMVEALSQVIFATSIDETRPILTGVLMIFKGKDLTLVGTDGFRLSQKSLSISGNTKTQNLVLPKGILGEVIKTSTEKDNLFFEYKKEENQVTILMDDTILSTRILEGEFPDYEKIIPKSSSIKINTDKDEFLRAVKLASIFARDSANIVKVEVGKDSLTLSAESQSSGSQKTKIDAKVDGGELEIAFNYRFLEEFTHSIKGEEIQMQFSNSNAPGIFSDPKDLEYLHLIMPVKVQG
ncbi:MAG: DNA polymerase III subunit beta [Patescibacteria group bacterium]